MQSIYLSTPNSQSVSQSISQSVSQSVNQSVVVVTKKCANFVFAIIRYQMSHNTQQK